MLLLTIEYEQIEEKPLKKGKKEEARIEKKQSESNAINEDLQLQFM